MMYSELDEASKRVRPVSLCEFACVCATPCAFHVVSPRDLWLCVLPRWQFNVNVNVKKEGKLGISS